MTLTCRQSTPATATSSEGDDAVALPATLVGPIALLTSHLTYLHATLPQATATALYRRIASHLALHILQRAIMYRGRGRISPVEGKAIRAESELWAETSRHALLPSGAAPRAEGPWRMLLQAGRVVGAQGAEWERIVDATFGVADDQEWEQAMLDVVGLGEMSREDIGRVARTRTDCGR